MTERFKVIIVGSGFGGQAAAIHLQKAGIEDFCMLERRDFLGGTWAQNLYPGAAVDVHSPLYSFSFELYPWSQMFADQEELRRYTHQVIDRYGLDQKAVLNASVVDMKWNEEDRVWRVRTEDGRAFEGRYLINATGPLSQPVIPDFEGRESFAGVSFHTNGWDQDYDYRGKRVAVIGSGASAAQVVPELVKSVAELHVFQRTPHWVLPRPDHTFSPLERELLKVDVVHKALRGAIYWGLEGRVIGMKYSDLLLRVFGESRARHHLKSQIRDPDLRRRLTPDYRIGCKRVILSSELYPALADPRTTVYTSGRGVASIDEDGILTEDRTHIDLDLIVYATGYDATDGVVRCPIEGRNGLTVQSFWSDFPRAYLGTAIPGLPNFFIMLGPNTGIGHTSAVHIIESQVAYIIDAIRTTEQQGCSSIEVRPEAESAYTEMIHREMKRTVWHSGGCDSWYKSQSGRVIAMFPGFSFTYRKMASKMRLEHHRLS